MKLSELEILCCAGMGTSPLNYSDTDARALKARGLIEDGKNILTVPFALTQKGKEHMKKVLRIASTEIEIMKTRK